MHKYMNLLRLEEDRSGPKRTKAGREVRAIHNGLRLKDICLRSATTPNRSTSRWNVSTYESYPLLCPTLSACDTVTASIRKKIELGPC